MPAVEVVAAAVVAEGYGWWFQRVAVVEPVRAVGRQRVAIQLPRCRETAVAVERVDNRVSIQRRATYPRKSCINLRIPFSQVVLDRVCSRH